MQDPPKNWCLLAGPDFPITSPLYGPVAQLIERFVRNEEVVGLIPIRSTSLRCSETDAKTAASKPQA